MLRLAGRCALVSVLVFGCGAAAGDIVYDGQLSVAGGGILGNGDWLADEATFEWSVSRTGLVESLYLWQYTYMLTVPRKAVSHIIIETTDNLGLSEIERFQWSADGQQWHDYALDEEDVGQHRTRSGNFLMPEDVYGVKFSPPEELTTLHVRLSLFRSPVWGDFFAKGGGGRKDPDVVWNSGFGPSPDFDPSDPAAGGALYGHILRPDSMAWVPEPATLMSLLAGAAAMVLARRRRR